ncbi:MAG: hypothetical protein DWQ08_05715, partial [Proteobacteria bacterium]
MTTSRSDPANALTRNLPMPEPRFEPLPFGFGAQVVGVRLSNPVDAELGESLRRALPRHRLLLFRGQALTAFEQVAVAECFGRLRNGTANRRYPSEHSKVDYVSNIDRGGRFLDRNPDPHSAFWHSDGSWAKTPPKATLLYADQAPKSGGETRF